MFGLNKKADQNETEAETNLSPNGDGDGPKSPLAGSRVVDGKYVRANDNFPSGDADGDREGRLSTDDVKRFYTEDKFHNHVVKICAFVGKKKGYQSLQIDQGDEAFRAAVEVVYRRLADSAIAPLLERLGDQALEDVVILAIGFGPVVKGVMQEKVAKRKAAGVTEKPANDEEKGQEHVG